jgi:hypothetical protein
MFIFREVFAPVLFIGFGIVLGYYFPDNVEAGVEGMANLVSALGEAIVDYIHTITAAG